jgi:hypothetical protein
MNDRPVILTGLLLALALFTFPAWYNLAAGTRAAAPQPALPGKTPGCIAPRDYMRTSHMALLVTWRNDVVRRGAREFVTADGRHYEKNLAGTCFGCHRSKKDFCDRCHDYAGVTPTCMNCHVDPDSAASASQSVAPGRATSAARLKPCPTEALVQAVGARRR